MTTVLITGVAFVAGVAIGAWGYYLYANHLYMRHPAFMLQVLQYKIAKSQGKTDEEAYKVATTEKKREEDCL